MRKKIRDLKVELETLRGRPGRVGPDHRKLKITENLVELYHREETMWRQQSRIQWLSEGDRNTHFYHQQTSMRKPKNKIKKLHALNGDVVSDPEAMESMATKYYQNLFSSEGALDMEGVLDMAPCKVTLAMNDLQCKPYSQEEVKSALFQMYLMAQYFPTFITGF